MKNTILNIFLSLEWKYGRWSQLAGYIHGQAIFYLPQSLRATPSPSIQISTTPLVDEYEESVDDEKESSSGKDSC